MEHRAHTRAGRLRVEMRLGVPDAERRLQLLSPLLHLKHTEERRFNQGETMR